MVVDGTMYLTGHRISFNIEDHTTVAGLITVKMDTKQVGLEMYRPELYNLGTWGGWQYSIYCTYNPLTKTIIGSFSADPFIHQLNLSGGQRSTVYASSKHFKTIEPFSIKKFTNETAPIPSLEKYDFTTPQFGRIVFDSFNDLYYRFAYLPLSDERYANAKLRSQRDETVSFG